MTTAPTQPGNRLDRRKARTRAALIRAAQTLIAEGRTNVPILEITQAADVGMGSFYNHFETKEQLFDAAVEDVMDAYGQLMDRVTGEIEDPAEVFATSFRLTGRLHRREPELSKVLLNNALRLLSAPNGLAPRARRDIEAASKAGRFDVTDLDVAVAMTAGALIALGHLLHDQPERDVDETTDRVTRGPAPHVRDDAPAGAADLLHAASRGRRSRGQRLSGLTVRRAGSSGAGRGPAVAVARHEPPWGMATQEGTWSLGAPHQGWPQPRPPARSMSSGPRARPSGSPDSVAPSRPASSSRDLDRASGSSVTYVGTTSSSADASTRTGSCAARTSAPSVPSTRARRRTGLHEPADHV